MVLTTKGRELYASGTLSPAYYKFYDENIIYDAANTELQNETYERIKNALYERPITSEGQFLESGGGQRTDIPMLHNELGEYDCLSQNAPAWRIFFNDATYDSGSFSKFPNELTLLNKNNVVEGSASLGTINTYEERVPQFNMNVELKYYKMDGQDALTLYEDEQNRDIFLNIEEKNSFLRSERQDLEIEVFKIVDFNDNNKWLVDLVAQEETASLKKLEFNEEKFDENTVETFLNILTDSAAAQQNNLKIKNIYTGVVPDPMGYEMEECED